MTPLHVYFIDAFTTEAFKGNPAAVIVLDQWLPAALMQSIATENNLSETAFLVQHTDGRYHIRWFSPLKEIAFCGHATLASAYVLLSKYSAASPLTFWAEAIGNFTVVPLPDGQLELDFPNQMPAPIEFIPPALLAGLSIKPAHVLCNRQAYFAVYAHENEVREVVPDLNALKTLAPLDVVVTAAGVSHDFVSRYFWPANGGDEDPVTGSIHTGLAPYWAAQLGKAELSALQASRRTGELRCRVVKDRVLISGNCVQYLHGLIDIQAAKRSSNLP